MRKLSAVLLTPVLGLVLMGASECDLGNPKPDKPGSTEDTVSDCLVYGQATNSKGQHYLEIRCSLPGGGTSTSAELLPNNSEHAWLRCSNGANWPECKEG